MLRHTNRGLNYCSLYKIMLQNSHNPQASIDSTIAQASTFSTRTPLTHNNMSSVHTHSPVPVPRKFTDNNNLVDQRIGRHLSGVNDVVTDL